MIGSLAGPAPAQTLNLGDPKLPDPSLLVAARGAVRKLQQGMDQIGESVESTDPAERTLAAARLQWRVIAAQLLEHPDPLGDPEIVLLGWGLVEHGSELDSAIQSIVHSGNLDADQREEALWELKRFAAAPVRNPAMDDASYAAQPANLSEIRAAIRPLVEVLSPAPDAAASDDSLATRLAAATGCFAEDRDLAPLQAVVHRCIDLRSHAGWRVEAEITLNLCLSLLDDVRVLDEAQRQGSAWQQFRSAAIVKAVEKLEAPRAEFVAGNSRGIREFAELNRTLNRLSLLPPSLRPQLEPFRIAIDRCLSEFLTTGPPPAWPLLSQAIDALCQRDRNVEAATQHELRIACKALDAQSDQLERMMGECLDRQIAAVSASDPRWATVIGQHRANVEARRTLIKLPAAIDSLEQYDRHAGPVVWPQLLPRARDVDDPRSRQALLARASEIVRFHDRHSVFPAEGDWRARDESFSALVGDQRERLLEHLDALRRLRAAEIVAADPKAANREELDAMHDLFRLVEVARVIRRAEVRSAETGLMRHLGLPAGFAEREASRLEASLKPLFDLAATGGGQLVRAVERVRRDAANAIIIAQLVTASEDEPSSMSPALMCLTAIARSAAWGHATSDVFRVRLGQWQVLQFELFLSSGDRSPAPESVKQYAQFLAERLADGLWTR